MTSRASRRYRRGTHVRHREHATIVEPPGGTSAQPGYLGRPPRPEAGAWRSPNRDTQRDDPWVPGIRRLRPRRVYQLRPLAPPVLRLEQHPAPGSRLSLLRINAARRHTDPIRAVRQTKTARKRPEAASGIRQDGPGPTPADPLSMAAAPKTVTLRLSLAGPQLIIKTRGPDWIYRMG